MGPCWNRRRAGRDVGQIPLHLVGKAGCVACWGTDDCPVESVNCASPVSAATVVISLIVTDAGRALDIPSTPINPIAVLLPDPAFPPSTTR